MRKHLDSIRCVDLFCGAGGLSYGFSLEGLPVAAGIDLDPACKYPYEANNCGTFIHKNIRDVTGSELKGLFGDAQATILAGCAPCQPFSTYTQGKDTSRDQKWTLLYEFLRLVKSARPDIVTMENVPTVTRHAVFSEFAETLQSLRYHVWHDVIECSKYEVPQTRRRLVLLASRLGPISMVPPKRERPKTVRQALGRLAPIQAGERHFRDRLHTSSSLSPLNKRRIKASKPGGTWRDWPRSLVADCHKDSSGKTYPSVYGRMEWDKPAPTITTQCHGFGNGRFGHPEQDRAISLREAAILQGFPRSYKFVPPTENIQFSTIGRLIGNAVPVDLGRAVARSVIEHVRQAGLIKKTKDSQQRRSTKGRRHA